MGGAVGHEVAPAPLLGSLEQRPEFPADPALPEPPLGHDPALTMCGLIDPQSSARPGLGDTG